MQHSDIVAPAALASDLLLSPTEPAFVEPTPAGPAPPPYSSHPTTTPTKPTTNSEKQTAYIATSLQTQEDLSLQLAEMAKQLKLNALHFTNALEKDRAVVQDAEEKLEGNLTKVKAQRSRLLVHSGKSGKTTWLVLGSMVVVLIAWVLLFLVIRIT